MPKCFRTVSNKEEGVEEEENNNYVTTVIKGGVLGAQ